MSSYTMLHNVIQSALPSWVSEFFISLASQIVTQMNWRMFRIGRTIKIANIKCLELPFCKLKKPQIQNGLQYSAAWIKKLHKVSSCF